MWAIWKRKDFDLFLNKVAKVVHMLNTQIQADLNYTQSQILL